MNRRSFFAAIAASAIGAKARPEKQEKVPECPALHVYGDIVLTGKIYHDEITGYDSGTTTRTRKHNDSMLLQ